MRPFSNVTANGYWRLLWIMPLTIAVPLLVSELAVLRKKKSYRISLTLLLGLVLVLSGTFVFKSGSPLVSFDASRAKIPQEITGVIMSLESIESGRISSVEEVATYIRPYSTRHEVLTARRLYLTVHNKKSSQEFIEQEKIFNVVTGEDIETDISEFIKLIKKYEVDYVIMRSDNLYIGVNDIENQFKKVYSDNIYTLYEL